MKKANTPVVLCFSGLDPTGGAGIQADIEAIAKNGCHATSVITANTVQDTHNVIRFETVNENLLLEQARAILEDMPVSAIKIGMIGSASLAVAIASILKQHPDIPVIFDPVLAAGGGSSLAQEDLIKSINELIIPLTHILTPNTSEALRLAADKDSASDAAASLNRMGADYVLLTGTHANTPLVVHKLFHNTQQLSRFEYNRLDNEFHGSGCTLAASLAAHIARSKDIIDACQMALDYTFESLQNAQSLGGGQRIPRRI